MQLARASKEKKRLNDMSTDHHLDSIDHPLERVSSRSLEAGENPDLSVAKPIETDRYRMIVEDQTEVVSRFTADGTFLFANDVYCRTFGKPLEEIIGSRWHPVAHPDDVARIESELKTISLENPVVRIENRVFTADGLICWMEFVNRGFFDSDGNLTEIQSVGRDITERRRAEEQLRASEDRMRLAMEAGRIGTWDWDFITGKVSWSSNLESALGFEPGEFGGTIEDFKALVHPEDLPIAEAAIQEAVKNRTTYQTEFRMLRADGAVRWTTTKGRALYDERGNAIRMVGVDVDISERMRVEDELRASVNEREVLLRELHHRVKNNLQVISSLLYLQSEHARDKETVDLFRESEQRVISMALVHELLYRSKDLSQVDFRGYLEMLSDNLVRAYRRDTVPIELDVRCEAVFLPLESAVPCGLLVNELITNCLKHAFVGRETGRILIELRELEGSAVLLRVCDNGVGIPDSVRPESAETFGMQLITTLTEQLHGTLEVSNQGGTDVRISFSCE